MSATLFTQQSKSPTL